MDHRHIRPVRPTMSREPLPARRASWTIKGVINGHTFHLGFGEYPDGTLGEIWIDAAKTGTTMKGVSGLLARMASMSLQCGADVREVVGSLRDTNFPPNGVVVRGDSGRLPTYEASSLGDWIAFEIAAAYLLDPSDPSIGDSDARPLTDRSAGPPPNANSKGDGRGGY